MFKVEIEVHRLYFVLKAQYNEETRSILRPIEKELTTAKYEWNPRTKQLRNVIDKEYYVYNNKDESYRFPITLLKSIVTGLITQGIKKEEIKYTLPTEQEQDRPKVNYNWNNKYVLRDYQEEYVNAVMHNLNKPIFLIDLHTGYGKGIIACMLFKQLGYRVAIFLLPKYVKKWIAELKDVLKLRTPDICVIQGESNLSALMETPKRELKYKVYIFSIPTMQRYISSYEEGEKMFTLPPEQLMDHIGANIMFNDETHQHFHAIAKLMLYNTSRWFIGSTATLVSDDTSLNKVYNIVIPKSFRIANIIGYNAYVTTIPVSYRIAKVDKRHRLKVKRAQGYSHNLFEQNVLGLSRLKFDYYKMIYVYIKQKFLYVREDAKKDKMVIFFASIDMCDDFTNWLKKQLPNEKICRYIGGDDYHTMLKNNIIVSNVQMLGTAIDIPNLITVIQTVSIRSVQANLQNFGRLRKIKDRELYYVYLYCGNMAEQIKLHQARIRILEERSKVVKYEFYNNMLYLF